MTFEDIIKTNRKNISQSSVRTYLSAIKSVAKAINKTIETPEDIIAYHENIIDFLNTQKLNVRKTKLSAFIVSIDKGKKDGKSLNTEQVDKVLVKFRDIITKDGKDYEEQELKQTLTETQKKNFIEWDDVMKIYEELKTEAEPLFKLERLNLGQFRKLQNYVLVSCYVLIPPRRSMDYVEMKIRNINEASDNFMRTKNKKKPSTFVFNKYKNSGRLGSQEVVIPNTLRNIIMKWMEKNPYDYLIVNNNGEKVTISKINQLLNDIFKKNFGSSLMRHSWATNKYSNINLEELTKDAYSLGQTNPERLLKYVNKK